MTARVDAAVGVVADGDATWPLRLDVRTGAAVLTVGDREIAVTPLQWRHKQQLARWAHLGPAFVAIQRAALAVEPGTALDGLGRLERDLVDAVVEFLDDDALPYEPGLLAGVAVEACRATGLAPGAFDDRDAVEVELMWRVGASGATAPQGPSSSRDRSTAVDPWADAISIVFTDPVPPPPAGEPGSTGAGPAGEVPTVSVADDPAPSSVATATATGGDAAGRSGPPAPGPLAPLGHGPEPDRSARHRPGPRHRIVPAPGRPPLGAARTEAAPEARSAAGPRPAVGSVRPAMTPPVLVSRPTADRSANLADAALVAPEASPQPAGVDNPPPASPVGPFHGPAVALAPGPLRPHPAADSAGARGDVSDSFDALVVAVADRLAEQFAAAADGLGIEV